MTKVLTYRDGAIPRWLCVSDLTRRTWLDDLGWGDTFVWVGTGSRVTPRESIVVLSTGQVGIVFGLYEGVNCE